MTDPFFEMRQPRTPYFIALAGGSGAGKSTLAHAFADRYPDCVRVLHLDDYRKERELLPRVGAFVNWDHPDTIYWDQLVNHLKELRQGRAITIHKNNEHFDIHGLAEDARFKTIEPAAFIVLDGFHALLNPEIRACFDFSVFLDLSHEQRIARRKKFNDVEDARTYFDSVLIPMHEQFVEPTKHYATMVIDVEHISQEEVMERFIVALKETSDERIFD